MAMKINWNEVKENAETLYPAFEAYVKKRGLPPITSLEEIKIWYDFLEFVFTKEKK